MDESMTSSNTMKTDVYRFNNVNKVICANCAGKKSKVYKLINKDKNTVYELDIKDYYLCKLCNGKNTINTIIETFSTVTGDDVDRESLIEFLQELEKEGIIDKIIQIESSKTINIEDEARIYADILKESKRETELKIDDENNIEEPSLMIWIWESRNPQNILRGASEFSKSIRGFINLAQYSLVILFPLAIGTILNNIDQLKADYTTYLIENIPNIFGLLTVAGVQASLAGLASGIVTQSFNNPPTSISFGLLMGFIPQVAIRFKSEYLTSRQRRIAFSSIIKVRMFVLSVAVYIWQTSHTYGTTLPFYTIIFIITGFIGLIIDSFPLWPSPGYYSLISAIDKQDVIRSTISIWLMLIKGVSLPKELSARRINISKVIGIIGLIEGLIIIYILISFLSRGISDVFVKEVFGEGARWLISLGLTLYVANVVYKFWKAMSNAREAKLGSIPTTKK